MCNMVPYKLKVMYVEDDILNFSPIIQNKNGYHSEEKNCGDDSIKVLPYDNQWCDNIISGNSDISGNNILEVRKLVLSTHW